MKTNNMLLENGVNTLCEALGQDIPESLAADALSILSKYQEGVRKQKVALQNVAEVLELVLVEEGPYIMTTTDGSNTWDREVTREEMLQHHIEVAIQQINELMEGE